MSELRVMIDERGRLITAVLAAGVWPELAQREARHAVHPHAKQTRHFLQPYADHPAVQRADAWLHRSGGDVKTLFTVAFRCRWPDFQPQEPMPEAFAEEWVSALADFQADTAVSGFWLEHEAQWQKAVDELQAICHSCDLHNFLRRLTKRPLHRDLAIMPNLVYPALRSILAETGETLYLLLPPPKAVGESPPWPYDEAPDWVISQTGQHLVHYALRNEIKRFAPEKRPLLIRGAITLFLEESLDKAEAMAYMIRSKKQYDLPELPLAVESLRQHLKTKERTFPEFFL